ncbi:MAG: four helix bundle protein [Bacteroidales bacterium]|nr:four helix bundle protein [Bacteroidales bacterium]
MKEYGGFKDLIVYQKSYRLSLKIFEITKIFPVEEKYGLIDQIRRSSRSIPANISEAWAKRIYPKNFISKLLDAKAETNETVVWIDTSKDCNYIDLYLHSSLVSEYSEIAKMLNSMIKHPEKFATN